MPYPLGETLTAISGDLARFRLHERCSFITRPPDDGDPRSLSDL